MLWTDIQQSINSTNNYNNALSPTSASFQAAASLKQNQPYPYNHSVRTGSMSSSTEEEENASTARCTNNLKRKSSLANDDEDNNDEKRKNFLERNRQAALKCRQRKKQWLHNLQERVEYLANDNEQLQLQANVMRDEVLNLRNLLMVHKDCHMSRSGSNKVLITQQQPPQQLPQLALLQQLPPQQQQQQQQQMFTNNNNIAASAIVKNALI